MAIITSKYESNAGGVYKIRLDEDKAILQGGEPTAAITDPNVEVVVSNKGRKRKFGIAPRGAIFKRTVPASDGTVKSYYGFFPALTQANLTALVGGGPISYGGFDWDYVSVVEET